jgi:hypothetical protein
MTCGTMLKRPEPGPDAVRHEQIAQSFREKKSKLLDTRYASSPDPTPEAPPKKFEVPVLCPFCGHVLTPDAVICVACGRNLRSGRSLSKKRRNPLVLLGRFFTFIFGFIEILAKGVLCVVLVIVIILAGRTFFKEEPATKTAPESAGQPRAPTEALEQIIEVAEQPAASTNAPEPGKDVAEPSTASTNAAQPDKAMTELAKFSTNSIGDSQEAEITEVVNAIMTSWKDRTTDYEKHLGTGYSSGQLTSPVEWKTRAFDPDTKNPDVVSVTVFVKRINASGKPMQANWTFKFIREDGQWKLASWFE